jgi:hypothetical protein
MSGTMDRVDWNAELVRGDLGKAVQQLKRESGKGRLMGGAKLSLAWGMTRIRRLFDLLLTFANDRSVQGALGSAGGRRCRPAARRREARRSWNNRQSKCRRNGRIDHGAVQCPTVARGTRRVTQVVPLFTRRVRTAILLRFCPLQILKVADSR